MSKADFVFQYLGAAKTVVVKFSRFLFLVWYTLMQPYYRCRLPMLFTKHGWSSSFLRDGSLDFSSGTLSLWNLGYFFTFFRSPIFCAIKKKERKTLKVSLWSSTKKSLFCCRQEKNGHRISSLKPLKSSHLILSSNKMSQAYLLYLLPIYALLHSFWSVVPLKCKKNWKIRSFKITSISLKKFEIQMNFEDENGNLQKV